jgi:hypothetical protein
MVILDNPKPRDLTNTDGTLHFLSLPNLEPVPSTLISPLRGVVSIILNDDELEWGGPGSEDKTAEMAVVVVRRKGLGVYKLGTRMVAVKVSPVGGSRAHVGQSRSSSSRPRKYRCPRQYPTMPSSLPTCAHPCRPTTFTAS